MKRQVKRAPQGTGQDERFTLPETVEWCKNKVNVSRYDLDVAACDESHWAENYYTKEKDGLLHPWDGNAWCNPPFSDIGNWVERAWNQIGGVPSNVTSISMLLPACRTEQPWWQKWIEPYRDALPTLGIRAEICLGSYFLPNRTKFGSPGNPLAKDVGSPPFGCVLLVWKRTEDES